MRAAVSACIAAACWISAARADSPGPELIERFREGRYLEAAALAEERRSADDLAFAARSLLAYCFTEEKDPDPALVARARALADAALKADPRHEEGRLQLAIAVSLQSRPMGGIEAMRSGLANKGRALAESVASDDPANYFAHGFLAVWHVEVRRRGGSLGARWLGASLDAAAERYARAAELAPDDVGVHWQYARALAVLDIRRHKAPVESVLARALAADAGDHVERVMQARARRLLELLESDIPAAQAYAGRVM